LSTARTGHRKVERESLEREHITQLAGGASFSDISDIERRVGNIIAKWIEHLDYKIEPSDLRDLEHSLMHELGLEHGELWRVDLDVSSSRYVPFGYGSMEINFVHRGKLVSCHVELDVEYAWTRLSQFGADAKVYIVPESVRNLNVKCSVVR